MQTKLTVRVDQELIQAAKRSARQQGVSLSHLVEAYLRTLVIQADEPMARTPVLQRLMGILPQDISIDEYRQHLEEKYSRRQSRSMRLNVCISPRTRNTIL